VRARGYQLPLSAQPPQTSDDLSRVNALVTPPTAKLHVARHCSSRGMGRRLFTPALVDMGPVSLLQLSALPAES